MQNIEMLKNLLFSAIAGMVCLFSAIPIHAWEYSTDQAPYSYARPDDKKNVWGFGKKETISVAIKISDPGLVGKKVIGVRVPFNGTDGISNLSGWTSSELTADSYLMTPDGSVAQAEIVPNDFTEIIFDQPYEIPAGDFYAGYTFTVDRNTTDSANPVVSVSGNTSGGQYVLGSYSKRKWTDMSTSYGVSAMEVIIGGLDENALGLSSISTRRGTFNNPNPVYLTVSNHGTTPVKSFDYTYTFNGTTGEGHFDIAADESIASDSYYGTTFTAMVELPAMNEEGSFPVEFTITKVNGEDNDDAVATGSTTLKIVRRVAKKNPVVEEYTGTWCQYCIRGYAGMEYMTKNFEDFIGIVYHNNDPMEVMAQSAFPEGGGGYPFARMDRSQDVDAFYGYEPSSSMLFGLDGAWYSQSYVSTPADVTVTAEWNEDKSELTATSTLDFVEVDGTIYRLAYALLHDEMSGSSASWAQKNGYAGNAGFFGHPLMDEYAHASAYVSGLKFNDVYIAGSKVKGINNSVPYDLEPDTKYEHSYTFKMADIKGTTNANLLQDKNKLKVVVLLLNTRGQIVNAAKAFVPGYDGELMNVKGNPETLEVPMPPVPSEGDVAVENISNDDDATVIAVYDLMGRRVSNPENGIYIFRLSNGKTVKRVVK